MLIYPPQEPLGLPRLTNSPGLPSKVQGRRGSPDILLWAPTNQVCFWSALGWCERSLLLAHWASPLPQASKCSCYLWLLCPRRKPCADSTPPKRVEGRAGRALTQRGHSPRPSGPEFYTRLYNTGLGGKTRTLKKFEKLNCCVLVLYPLLSGYSLRPYTCQMLVGMVTIQTMGTLITGLAQKAMGWLQECVLVIFNFIGNSFVRSHCDSCRVSVH